MQARNISIHALREEGDSPLGFLFSFSGLFLSTPSARRATISSLLSGVMISVFLSTPSARRATLHFVVGSCDRSISIHALREEGDGRCSDPAGRQCRFLSTPSARRATLASPVCLCRFQDFYPRPPRGGRPPAPGYRPDGRPISIHALREEGDRCPYCLGYPASYFYPRPPRGGRLRKLRHGNFGQVISIHALREEGDMARDGFTPAESGISIHALREEGDK